MLKTVKQRVAAPALRKRMDAAMADFSRPTLGEMLETGQRLSKSTRFRRKARTPTRKPRRRVTIFPHDDLGDERTSNQTLDDLLSAIRRKRPRQETESDWTFTIGGKRDYVGISTQGPRAFLGQYPVWHGETFKGCMLFELEWADVRRILEKFYDRSPIRRCFAGLEGSPVGYPREKRPRRK